MSDQQINFFTTKPFISLDGVDDNGVRAEVQVVKGYTPIVEFDEEDKSVNVSFRNPESKYKWRTSGRISKKDPLYEVVKKAWDDGTPLYFRIEKIRRSHVDRSLPFDVVSPPKDADAARDNIFKNLVAVKVNEDDEWTLGDNIKTRVEDDPRGNGSPSAYDTPVEALKAATPAASRGGITTGVVGSLEDDSVESRAHVAGVYVKIYNFLSQEMSKVDNRFAFEGSLDDLAALLLRAANDVQVSVSDGELEAANPYLPSHAYVVDTMLTVIRNEVTVARIADAPSPAVWAKKVRKETTTLAGAGLSVARKVLGS